MKPLAKSPKIAHLSVLVAVLAVTSSKAASTQVSVDPGENWIGFMNVFNLPADGGAYQFGSVWGTSDLRAGFSGNTVTLSPNTNVYNPTDTFWVKPNGDGNKNMDASFYVQNDALAGLDVNFVGNVLGNTLVNPYTSVAFIKDFDASFNLVGSATVALVGGSTFSVDLVTNPGDHIQYGFETIGPDANPNTADLLGNVTIVPEPSTLALLALAGVGSLAVRRRR